MSEVTLLHICPNHLGLGEIMAGIGTTEQIRAQPCALCELKKAKAEIRRLEAERATMVSDHEFALDNLRREYFGDET